MLTAFTLALEEWTYRGYGKLSDRLYLMLVSPVEGLGCRQLTAVWRFRGLARYGRAGREWGVMTRSCLCSTPGSHGSICPKSLASAPASPVGVASHSGSPAAAVTTSPN